MKIFKKLLKYIKEHRTKAFIFVPAALVIIGALVPSDKRGILKDDQA